jgi:hypothetical protein
MATATLDARPKFRCRTVLLKLAKHRLDQSFDNWIKAPPFIVNPRGQLIHRVRDAATVLWQGVPHHIGFSYLCGNQTNCGLDEIAEVFVADPPRDRLICARCELMAKAANLPSASELAGRHVHRGILVPQRVCCQRKAST